MKYKITQQCAVCTILTDCRGHDIEDCLKCGDGMRFENTSECTQEEYLRLLDHGNVVITKVEVLP